MKSRRQTLFLWAIALTTLVSGAMVWHRYSQPRFHGKTMAEWLDETPRQKITTRVGMTVELDLIANHTEFTSLLQNLGTNALSPLIALLDEGDSSVEHWMRSAIRSGRLPSVVKARFTSSLDRSTRRRSLAASAFQMMGTNALHAIPTLEKIIRDPNHQGASVDAISILKFVGRPALPALQRSVTNAPESRRASVEGAIIAIYRMGIKSTDPVLRESSLLDLSETPYATFETMFPLIELLDSPVLETRRRALNGLGRHLPTVGPSLIIAYHAVEKQTAADDPEMRRVATALLAKLNPPPPGMKP